MSNLTRWNPVRDLITMNDWFNRDWPSPMSDTRWMLPALDMYETDDALDNIRNKGSKWNVPQVAQDQAIKRERI